MNTAHHVCGGTILAGEPLRDASGNLVGYRYCDRCRAFQWNDCDEDFPSGTDEKANREAWDNCDWRSPDAEEVNPS